MKLKREVFSAEIAGLAWSFCVSPDSCDNPPYYENYIRLSAISDANIGQAVTHIFLDEEQDRIAGYIAFRATALASSGEDGRFLCHPALEIAELAVDKDYERQGVGTTLIDFAILLADELRQQIGIRTILVVADPKAVPFYEKQGFSKISAIYTALHDGWNDNCIPMCVELE